MGKSEVEMLRPSMVRAVAASFAVAAAPVAVVALARRDLYFNFWVFAVLSLGLALIIRLRMQLALPGRSVLGPGVWRDTLIELVDIDATDGRGGLARLLGVNWIRSNSGLRILVLEWLYAPAKLREFYEAVEIATGSQSVAADRVPYDPSWLIAIAREQAPEDTVLLDGLARSTHALEQRPAYVSFVSSANANEPGAEWQFERNVTFDDTPYGFVVVDVLKDGCIGGIEFVDLIR